MSNDHIHHDHERHTPLAPAAEAHADSGTALRDPVCGMIVDPAAGKPMLDHAGHRYHFCSSACRDKFKAAPDIYVSAKDPVCGMDVARSKPYTAKPPVSAITTPMAVPASWLSRLTPPRPASAS